MRYQLHGNHPKDRMRERNVTDADIQYCLKNYNYSVTSRKTYELQATFPDGRVLKTWILTPPPPTDGVIIKSVAWKN